MSRPYRALDDLLRIPGALPRAGMYSPFRVGVAESFFSAGHDRIRQGAPTPRHFSILTFCQPFCALDRKPHKRYLTGDKCGNSGCAALLALQIPGRYGGVAGWSLVWHLPKVKV